MRSRKSSASTEEKVEITHVKKGRRHYGAIYRFPSGRVYYLAHRKVSEIFRSGEKSISEAIRKGTACWAIDEESLIELRVQGIEWVGVLCKDTGDKFLAPMSAFHDKSKVKLLNYETRGGALQRYLPLQHFLRIPGKRVKV